MTRALITNDDGISSEGLRCLVAVAVKLGYEVVLAAPFLCVDAAPAFIALAALRGSYGPPPDVVLSGIDRGANTGNAILHSGTVGAALTARAQGTRSMAVSLARASPRHWDTAGEVASRLAPILLSSTAPVMLNINVPTSSNPCSGAFVGPHWRALELCRPHRQIPTGVSPPQR